MAILRKDDDTFSTEQEGAFSKAMSGYNTKEVDVYIQDLKEKQDNAISNYKRQLDTFKNQLEMVKVECDQQKKNAALYYENEKKAISAAEAMKQKLQQFQNDFKNIVVIKEENDSLKKEIEDLRLKLSESKAECDSVKTELSSTKDELNELKNSSVNNDEESNTALENDIDNYEKIIGAYTVHLKKSKQLVEALKEQIEKAEDIF